MPPPSQYPAPAPERPEKSPYEFFMEPQRQQKNKLGPVGGMSGTKLVLLIAGIVIALIIIVSLAITLFSGKKDTAPEVSLAQAQQEIIRVASDGSKNSKSGNLQNFSVTAALSVSSAQQEYLALLASHGIKVDPKVLGLSRDAKTDQALAAALSANTYDVTYSTIMKTELDNYEARLREVTLKVTSKKDLSILEKQTNGAQLLRTQLLAEL